MGLKANECTHLLGSLGWLILPRPADTLKAKHWTITPGVCSSSVLGWFEFWTNNLTTTLPVQKRS